VDRVRTLVSSDRRVGVRVIAEELNMNRETVRQIVKEDLRMRKSSTKMVPRILTHDQKQRWLHISSDILRSAEMFDRVSTVMKRGFSIQPGIKTTEHAVENIEFTSAEKKHACLGRRSRPCLCVSSIARR
jgi:hypothetical protein